MHLFPNMKKDILETMAIKLSTKHSTILLEMNRHRKGKRRGWRETEN